MKKALLLAVFGLCALFATAQPEIVIESLKAEPGEEFCVPVRGNFFSTLTELQFRLKFDPALLTLTEVKNFGINEGFTITNVDLTQQDQGFISVFWQSPRFTCSSRVDEVYNILDDGEILFELCFRAAGAAAYGQTTPIELVTDGSYPLVTERLGSFSPQFGCTNLGFGPSPPGIISFSVRPFVIAASQETGNEGDLVCVDFTIQSGFDALTSIQYSINWDQSILRLESIDANDEIPNNSSSNYGVGGQTPGTLVVSWSFIPGQPPPSVADSTRMFTACFRIVGQCETSSSISFSSTPRRIEVTNEDPRNMDQNRSIPFAGKPGKVTVNDCDPPGVKLITDCIGPVNINDEICIAVRAGDNFQNLRELQYLMEWNPSILEFVRVQDPNSLPGLGAEDFNDANTGNGALLLSWSFTAGPMGQSLAPNTVIYEVCFKVVGLGGNSPFNIVLNNQAVARQASNGPNIGINPQNCEVEVIQPLGVGMDLGSGDAPPGDQVCVPVQVVNFEEIIRYQFSLNWDPNAWEYVGLRNINLAGASEANITAFGSSGLFFTWNSDSPVTLADEASIFEICFQPAATATPGDCSPLEMVELPLVSEAISSNSNNENIGILATTGEMCVLFPEGFGLTVVDTVGGWLDTTCVSFTVESFDNITAAQLGIEWSPGSLEFAGINLTGGWPGLAESNFDVSQANIGLLRLDWSSAGPTAIPDGTVGFEVCYYLSGEPDDCYPITITDDPAAVVTTSVGQGSLVIDNGELCIKDRIIIDSIAIKPPSCPGACDGEIEVFIRGGKGFIGTSWRTSPQQFTPLKARNLCEGNLVFTIYDQSSPSVTIVDSVMITSDTPLPVATIKGGDEDRVLPCNNGGLLLLSAEDTPGDVTYNWYHLDANGTADGTGKTFFASQPGNWILEVATPTGCAGYDTVFVNPPMAPMADAGSDGLYTCDLNSLQLDGSASSQGDSIVYQWTVISGGMLVDSTATRANAEVTGPGRYQLTVINNSNGCEATDEVTIRDGAVQVNAFAGSAQAQNCDGTPVILDGSDTFNPDLQVTYQWLDPMGNVISDSIRAEAVELGEYTLIVTDQASGCTGESQVAVLPNDGAPEIEAGEDQSLTCLSDTVDLAATVDAEPADVTVLWTAFNGGQLEPGQENILTPSISTPGLYQLRVTDNASNCAALDTVIVLDDKVLPTAEAGEADALGCTTGNVTLDGSASSQGDTIQYQWYQTIGDPLAQTVTTDVSAPGVYYLSVTNTANGCVAIDSVTVEASEDLPQIVLNEMEFNIGCTADTLLLIATIQPDTAQYDIVWSVEGGGNIIGATDGDSIRVDQAGTYRVSVTNTATGCSSEMQAVVNDDGQTPPTIAISADTLAVNCLQNTVTLDGTGSAIGQDITYSWTNIEGGETPATPNQLQTEVSAAGVYQLQVTDATTGCISDTTVVVVDLSTPPVLTPADVDDLDCQAGSVELSYTVDRPQDEYEIVWSGLNGGTPTPNDQFTTTVTEVGDYEIYVLNSTTGCEARDTITVVGSVDPPSLSLAGETGEFSCNGNPVTIDASPSGAVSDFSVIEWTSLSGNNTITPASGSLVVTVNGPGEYQLSVTSATTGCSADTIIIVEADQDTPQADAGESLELECGEVSQLDGSGSSQGAAFTYSWTVISGEALGGDLNSLTPQVSGAGTYQLIVSNAENNCSDTATVSVTTMLPPAAQAGNNLSVCGDTASLTANLPAGTSGQWTTLSGASIASPDLTNTAVSGLSQGQNTFVWTLSAPGCENYSADSVSVTRSAAPTANDDQLQITKTKRRETIRLTANDQLFGATNVSIRLLSRPAFGILDTTQLANGTIAFEVGSGVSGQTELEYEVCNLSCEGQCATARLLIFVDDDGKQPSSPNTITPNGDGMNDAFVFDILLNNPPEEFPHNELIVFNRWGDVVYQAKPYNNDWDGRNESGQLLPEGTYYYILRLNISEGEIIRGDITVVR